MSGILSAPTGGRVPLSYLGDAVVTVGTSVGAYGFVGAGAGSILPQTWATSGLPVGNLYSNPTVGNFIIFRVIGVAPNSGWTTLTIGSDSYQRVDASYTVGTTTEWQWISLPSNPFGTTVGATRNITWS